MESPHNSQKQTCVCIYVCVQLFSGLEQDGRDEELMEIRFLAKKLAMNFSINLRLIRKPLLALHQCVSAAALSAACIVCVCV